MTSQRWFIGIGGVVGFVAGVLVTLIFTWPRARSEPQPPKIGGQKAPSVVREIDFEKRYDAHCTLLEKEPVVFRGCKIVGFTGPAVAGQEAAGGSSYRDYQQQHFDRWLVLELSDGRMAYIPSSSLRFLESAKAR